MVSSRSNGAVAAADIAMGAKSAECADLLAGVKKVGRNSCATLGQRMCGSVADSQGEAAQTSFKALCSTGAYARGA